MSTANDSIPKVEKGIVSWRSWLLTFAVLVLSALLVLGATTVYYLTGENYDRKRTVSWHGSQLTVQAGQGIPRDQNLEITGLDPQRRAIVEVPIQGMEARDYTNLALSAANVSARTRLELVWLDGTEQPKSLRLPPITTGQAVARLSDHRHWQGPVERLFLVVGAPLPEPIIIRQLSLHPAQPTAAEILRHIWRDWTAFEGRSGHSINFVAGGTRNALFPPVLAAAAWVLVSVALYGLAILMMNVQRPLVLLAVIFMVGWLMLDLRWQVDLLRHLETTKERFAGKSWEDKALAADDRDLFKVAHAVRDILGDEARDLSVIGSPRSLEGPYAFGRLRYHMVPHRLRRVWSTPPSTRELRRTDYLVLVPPFRGIRLDPDASALIRPDGEMLPVEVIHSDPKLLVLRHAKVGERP